jgi:hypothetical protein
MYYPNTNLRFNIELVNVTKMLMQCHEKKTMMIGVNIQNQVNLTLVDMTACRQGRNGMILRLTLTPLPTSELVNSLTIHPYGS